MTARQFRQGSALSSCRWVTFAGMTDLLYLVQLMKQELPETLCDLGPGHLSGAQLVMDGNGEWDIMGCLLLLLQLWLSANLTIWTMDHSPILY